MMELIALPILLMAVNYFLTYKNVLSLGHHSFFECGFENQLWLKLSPSLHFFKIGIIFVLFDLEILFLLSLYFNYMWLPGLLFLVFMWATLWLEFNFNSLSWTT